jgi:hypothetical protein
MLTLSILYAALRDTYVALHGAFTDARAMENAAYKRGELINR